MVVDMPVVPTTGYGSDSTENGGVVQRRRTREGTHFASFLDFFMVIFGAHDGTQFLLCVVEGRWVALTPGVELPSVGPSGRANL